MYCSNCGKELNDGVKFCPECGAKNDTTLSDNDYQKGQVFEGKIHKCPSCNGVLESFEAVCPWCGFEIRSANTTSRIQDFVDKLDRIESERKKRDNTDERILNLIRTYPVPNTKEDVFEFMMLATSNINLSALSAERYIDAGANNEREFNRMKARSEAWLAKVEQVYQKAEMSFGKDSDFKRIQDLYNSTVLSVNEAKKKKEKSSRKTNIIMFVALAGCFLFIFLMGLPSMINKYGNHEGEAQIPASNSSFTGKNYEDVLLQFENAGFTNVSTRKVEDLITGWITKDGSVESVAINGSTDYSSGTWVNSYSSVVISYHTFSSTTEEDTTIEDEEQTIEQDQTTTEDGESDNSSEKSEESTKEYNYDELYTLFEDHVVEKPYTTARDYIQSIGYTANYTHQNTYMDYTNELSSYSDKELDEGGWIVSGIEFFDTDDKVAYLYVNTTENRERLENQKNMEEQLSETLSPSYALAALEQYGQDVYPYGFKIHMLTGRLGETALDEDTWFMKYTCQVENEYGNKVEMTCEGKITGTNDNPKVYDFLVY